MNLRNRNSSTLSIESLEPRQLLAIGLGSLPHHAPGLFQDYPQGQTRISQADVDRLLPTLTLTATNEQFETFGIRNEFAPSLATSGSLINIDDVRADSRFAGIDGSGYTVVVIDTGVDLNHPFFGPDADLNGVADRIVFDYDFRDGDSDASDTDGHGTHVTSIVGSSDSNFKGVAPGADLVHLKVFPGGNQTALAIEESLQWSVENAARYNIASVNLSLGSGADNYFLEAHAFNDELKALVALGVVPVAATGNDHRPNSPFGTAYPAADPNTISVAAVYSRNDPQRDGVAYGTGALAVTTFADAVTPFSNRHPVMLDVLAPGAPVTAARNGGGTTSFDGTSMASPHVAGMVPLMQQLATQELGRRLSFDEVLHIIRTSGVLVNDGDDENDNVPNTGTNFPRLDSEAALEAVLAMVPDTTISGKVFLDANGDGIDLNEPGLAVWDVYLDENMNSTYDTALTETRNANGLPRAINDFDVFRTEIDVNGIVGRITDVNVNVDITHTAVGDIDVALFSPSGTRINLFSNVGGNQSGFSNVTLDDSAPTSIMSGTAPFSGFYIPEESLSIVNGESANGTWLLEVEDEGTADTGTLNSWSLDFVTTETRTKTNQDGNYKFEMPNGGTFQIDEIVPQDWNQTSPLQGFQIGAPTDGASATGLDFGNSSLGPALISVSPDVGQLVTTSDFSLDLTFSEQVVNLDAADIEVKGSAAGNAVVGMPIYLGNDRWRFPISGYDSGTLEIELANASNAIQDSSGNSLRPYDWTYDISSVVTDPQLLINEVDPGAAESVEIKNIGLGAVNLENWTLRTECPSCPANTTWTLPAFALQPNAYVAIHESSGTNDANNIYMNDSAVLDASKGGAVTLFDPASKGIDYVQWRSPNVVLHPSIFWNAPEPPLGASPNNLSRSVFAADTDTGNDWTWMPKSVGQPNLSGLRFDVNGPRTAIENSNAQFVISASGILDPGETVSVDAALVFEQADSSDVASFTAALDAAIAGTSIVRSGNTLTFDATSPSSISVVVAILGDTTEEFGEQIRLELSNNTSATGTASILGLSELQTDLADQVVVAAPRITSVGVSSSSWNQPFLDAIGATAFEVSTGAEQLSPLPWRNLNRIHVTFDKDVEAIASNEVMLLGLNTLDYSSTIAKLNYDASAQRLSIELSQPLEIDQLMLRIASSVDDANGNLLDGEWQDGVTSGSSGDGQPGGEFIFRFNVVPGDTDRSGTVSVADVTEIRSALGELSDSPNYSIFGDANGSGMVTVSDLGPLRKNLGTGTPTGNFAVAAVAERFEASHVDIVMLDERLHDRLHSDTDDEVALIDGDVSQSRVAFIP